MLRERQPRANDMQQRSRDHSDIVDLDEYRTKKQMLTQRPQWTPEQTERLIDEVSLYLLKAVRALKSIPQA